MRLLSRGYFQETRVQYFSNVQCVLILLLNVLIFSCASHSITTSGYSLDASGFTSTNNTIELTRNKVSFPSRLSETSISEVYALKTMYDTLNGDGWNWNINNGRVWRFNESMSSIDPCNDKWQGITCDCILRGMCHITKIALNSYLLNGSLSDMTNFTMIASLDLSENANLKGSLLPLNNLSSIEDITFKNTAISGDLSPLSNMTKLRSLDLGYSNIEGDLSPLSNLIDLQYIYLYETLVSGDLLPLSNLCNLQEVNIGNTSISGELPPLNNMVNLNLIDFHITSISGDLSPLRHVYSLENLNLANTYISGDLSALANLTNLIVLDLDTTLVSGSLSPLSHNNLQVIFIFDTALSGDLSPLGTLLALEYCALNNNNLYGTFPSLSNVSSLKYLNVANNQLTGNIQSYMLPESIETLDFSNNQLTKELDNLIFALPNLQVLDASINCMTLQFTDDICKSTSLMYLLLDGLYSSVSCREVLPIHIVDTIYATKLNVISNIPSCIYSLTKLKSLHMAGNGITGVLPSSTTLEISGRFKELVLANNQMSSAIPDIFQSHEWSTLDLSYNKFTGELSSLFTVTDSIRLKVNRLSGNIPSSLRYSNKSDVSILTGNIFACTSKQLDALDDEVGDKYTCGSEPFNTASVSWLVIIYMAALLLMIVSLYTAFGQRFMITRYIITCISYLQATEKHSICNIGITEQCIDSMDSSSNLDKSQTLRLELSNIRAIPGLMKSIRQLSGILTIVIVCIYLPLYSGLTYYYGTYSNQYAWTVSVAFLSGRKIGITLIVIYMVTLLVACCYNTSQASFTESLVYNAKRIETTRYSTYFIVFIVNMTIMLAMNGCYVYVLLNYGQKLVSLMEIFLSVFKVLWTNYALISLMKFAHIKCISAIVDEPFEHLHFLTIMSIINHIVLPCLASTLLDTNCFYNMMYSANTITSTFQKTEVIITTPTLTIVPVISTSSYSPSFTYSYQCSSIILTSYAGIFMYTALFSVVLPPTIDYMKNLIKLDRQNPGTNHVLIRVILYVLRCIKLDTDAGDDKGVIIDENYMTKTILAIIGNISVLVTFGVMQPVLGVVTYLAIVAQTMYREYCIELYLNELVEAVNKVSAIESLTEEDIAYTRSSRLALAALDKNLKELSHTLIRSTWQLLLFLGPFYGFFLFDIIGDDVGYVMAMWAPTTLLFLCLGIYKTPYLLKEYVIVSKNIALSYSSHSIRINFGKNEKGDDLEMKRVTSVKEESDITRNPINSTFVE